MAHKIVQNVIIESVAYDAGNVIDLSNVLSAETIASLEERGVITPSNDEVTVVHGDNDLYATVAAPAEPETTTVTDPSGTVPTPTGTTQDQIEQDLQIADPAPAEPTTPPVTPQIQ